MPHQEDTVLVVKYGSTHTQGHATPQSEPWLHHQEKAAAHLRCP
jgi:hypothetical protein